MTGEVTRVYMLDWDDTFLRKCKSKGIFLDMYIRYINEITLSCWTISRGWRYDRKNNIMKFSKGLWKTDTGTDED